MKIENAETLRQAIANTELEGVFLAPEVYALLKQAMTEKNVDTDDVKRLLSKPYESNR
ncbi:MAG: hypothetical protein ABJH28_08420 [Paraglaciecola sp.]|uniref:hypothetical protein n=1 Tax=Paraglaciecola sp. TaxID=1920173 RepID=UPI0032639B0B